MPSFGRKLNPDGLTAVDLALRRGHRQTVRALVKLSPELVGVQGREGITPLHYAAETDDAELLEEFLCRCPKSVEELTVREESAVHVAVKNRKLAAVRVLVRWLQKTGRLNVLEWKDCNDDTVLHIAASTNQPEVLKLLVERTNVREKNSAGLTALDIARQLPAHLNGTARSILETRENETTLFRFILPHNDKKSFFEMSQFTTRGMSGDTRNAFLVVTVLIATAAYQGVLSPPGGFNQGNNIINTNNVTNYNTTNTSSFDATGKAVMSKKDFESFMGYNSYALAFSLGAIVFLIPLTWVIKYVMPVSLVCGSLVYLLVGYLTALKVISPLDVNKTKKQQLGTGIIFIWVIVVFRISVLCIPIRRLRSPGTSTRPETP
ncbi:hypothetical protein ACP275_05G108900 [Erythranthe tilingii]